MGFQLAKGRSLSLHEAAPGARRLVARIGWRGAAPAFADLHTCALVVGGNGKVLSQEYIASADRPSAPHGCIRHGRRFDEALEPAEAGERSEAGGIGEFLVDLAALPEAARGVYFVVHVGDRSNTFGGINGVHIRLDDAGTHRTLARYDLDEDTSTETAMVLAELYRRGGRWRFRPLGQGHTTGWQGIARNLGISEAPGTDR